MASKEEIEIAVRVVKEIADNPSVGAVKDLIDLLESSGATNEVRVTEIKEKR